MQIYLALDRSFLFGAIVGSVVTVNHLRSRGLLKTFTERDLALDKKKEETA